MKGNTARVWHYSALFLALAAALVQSDDHGAIFGHKYFVRLVNNINDLSVLHFTCGSNSDTIGPRELAPNDEWEFGFHYDLGLTYFDCDLWYQVTSATRNQTGGFHAFRSSDVNAYGGVHAIWSIRPTGFWLFHIKTGQYTLYGKWD